MKTQYEVRFIFTLDMKYYTKTVQAQNPKEAIELTSQYCANMTGFSDIDVESVENLDTGVVYYRNEYGEIEF